MRVLPVVAVLLALPAPALADDGFVLLDHATVHGSGWAAVKAAIHDGVLEIRAGPGEDACVEGPFEWGSLVYDESLALVLAGRGRGGLKFLVADEPTREAEFQSDALGVEVRHQGAPCGGFESVWRWKTNGTHTLVMWLTGDLPQTEFAIRGSGGVELLGLTYGPATRLTSEDFHGALRAEATYAWYGAYAAEDVAAGFEAERTFVGFFSGDGDLRATAPDGERECPCRFTDLDSPGAYTFRQDAVSVGEPWDAVVSGADLRMP